MSTPLRVVSNKAIDRAGSILAADNPDPREYIAALQTANSWRESFSLPLRSVAEEIETIARQISTKAIVSRRLKRMESTILKLMRFPTSALSKMQDIGGCRAVFPGLDSVALFMTEDFREKEIRDYIVKDYIVGPKPSGYRSIHMVVPVVLEGEERRHRIEVQARTSLQHAWATAVETVDLFSRQALKLGAGDPKWDRFFALVSTLFAMREDTPPIPDTYVDPGQFRDELTSLWFELRVLEKMRFWSLAVDKSDQVLGTSSPLGGKAEIFLMTIDLDSNTLNTMPFSRERLDMANNHYALMEQRIRDGKNAHTVLVAVEHINDLRDAYPNLYADTSVFLEALGRYLDVPVFVFSR